MQHYQRHLIAHSCLVLLAAMLAGFMLGGGVAGFMLSQDIAGKEIYEAVYYGSVAGWARAHTGGITNGLLMIAVAFILPHTNFIEKRAARFANLMIFIGWANTIFYWLGNASPNRALSLSDNLAGATNTFGTIAFVLASIGAVLMIYILLVLARNFFKRS